MIAIGPAGFMQTPPAKRIAWCVKCEGPQECDERGCVVCAVLAEKAARYKRERAMRRRARLASEGVCINGKSHPAPKDGKRKCDACLEVHRKSNRSGK
jgi:hypothetical protein